MCGDCGHEMRPQREALTHVTMGAHGLLLLILPHCMQHEQDMGLQHYPFVCSTISTQQPLLTVGCTQTFKPQIGWNAISKADLSLSYSTQNLANSK